MNLIVQKFGGSSLENTKKIQAVADIISLNYNDITKVIVVVSAMYGTTDILVNYANNLTTINTKEKLSEYDVVIASGEQITVGLVTLALLEKGIKAKSLLGWQIPIYSNGHYSHAKITSINTAPIWELLNSGIVPIIAGFQGVYNNRIVTLGRGGSDTTAAAIAVAMNAHRCDIYTDVDGVFTADPRKVPFASRLKFVTYNEMLAMASNGAKVLHPRAAEIAARYSLNTRILSTTCSNGGTILVKKKEQMENNVITSITSNTNIVAISLINCIYNSRTIFEVIKILTNAGVVIEMMFVSQTNAFLSKTQYNIDNCQTPFKSEQGEKYDLKSNIKSDSKLNNDIDLKAKMDKINEIDEIDAITTIKINTMNGISGISHISPIIEDLSINKSDVVINTENKNHHNILTLIINLYDKNIAISGINKLADTYFTNITLNENIAKISLIGLGIKNNLNIIHDIFQILAENTIYIMNFEATDISISFFVEKTISDVAIKVLHFGLGLETI